MGNGKYFEGNFHKSLKRLPGASRRFRECCTDEELEGIYGLSMRILDGGKDLMERVWGDFLFFAEDGSDYLFECKSTSLKSLPLSQVKEHQKEKLLMFDSFRESMHACVAINFYDKEKDKTGRMWLLPIRDYLWLEGKMADEEKRESIPIGALEKYFRECPRIPGCMWDLSEQLIERI